MQIAKLGWMYAVLMVISLASLISMSWLFSVTGSATITSNTNSALRRQDSPSESESSDSSDDGCDFDDFVQEFDTSTLQVNCDNFHEIEWGEELGNGHWRRVYKATWRGRTVAVKDARHALLEDGQDVLEKNINEASVLQRLDGASNIVQLIGFCNMTTVMEFVPDNLEDFVLNKENEISVKRALELALDASKGLAQLHSVRGGPVIHGDIDLSQMLIRGDGQVLLNDLNLAKYAGPSRNNEKCMPRMNGYDGKTRSPEEYTEGARGDEKLDVYSLGVALWQLRSREDPFEDMEEDESFVKSVISGELRPSVEAMSDYPQSMQDLIVQTWETDPKKRPSAAEMVERITNILREI